MSPIELALHAGAGIILNKFERVTGELDLSEKTSAQTPIRIIPSITPSLSRFGEFDHITRL